MTSMMIPGHFRWTVLVLIAAFGLGGTVSAQNAAGFWLDDMDLRDPHMYLDFFGCNDITEQSINQGIEQRFLQDRNNDGFLDLSYLVEFLPLDRSRETNLMDFGATQCRALPGSITCAPVQASAIAGGATMLESGSICLEPPFGATGNYTPAITTPGSPCFLSPEGNLVLDVAGIPVPLQDVMLAATFMGDPGSGLTSGLIRGFLSEADADATIISGLMGGKTLSSLLPGGTGSCVATDDRDIHEGESGWWFLFNFTARRVNVQGPPDGLFANGFES